MVCCRRHLRASELVGKESQKAMCVAGSLHLTTCELCTVSARIEAVDIVRYPSQMELRGSTHRAVDCQSIPSTSYGPARPPRVAPTPALWPYSTRIRGSVQVARAMQLEDDKEELIIPPEYAVRTIPTPRLSPQEVLHPPWMTVNILHMLVIRAGDRQFLPQRRTPRRPKLCRILQQRAGRHRH